MPNQHDQPLKVSNRLVPSALIVRRCRQEGREAQTQGAPISGCPYQGDDWALERAGWLDGWGKQAAGR